MAGDRMTDTGYDREEACFRSFNSCSMKAESQREPTPSSGSERASKNALG
jgi:hypothetical protein